MHLRPRFVKAEARRKVGQVLSAQHTREQKVRQGQEEYEVEKYLVEDVHGGES
jgi:hypothetical protein